MMNEMRSYQIRVAVIGVGNCASSLIHGIHYYADRPLADCSGVLHEKIGPYSISDIKVVAAFDIDERKVGQDVTTAIFAPPNCTKVFAPDLPPSGVKVSMGRVLDGIADHMVDYQPARTFVRADLPEPREDDVIKALKASRAQILINYLPVGSQEATEFYAQCALKAGLGFVNCIPVFMPATHNGGLNSKPGTFRLSVMILKRKWVPPSSIGF